MDRISTTSRIHAGGWQSAYRRDDTSPQTSQSAGHRDKDSPTSAVLTSTASTRQQLARGAVSDPPSRNPSEKEISCDKRRAEEEESYSRLPSMSTQLLSKSVTPFLREHIPGQYAPMGMSMGTATAEAERPVKGSNGNPNSKYCYRHRPDSKCRRAADETKMASIQHELDKLTPDDQQAITHVWSLFSAAPSKHRDLMLQGIITQCCFPQLSAVSREVHEQLKIDFVSTLPVEISYKILCYLDTTSLCQAAQVSRAWRELADSDTVWHHLCCQHIDRKCTKCGFGLPLLERKRLRVWSRQQQLAHHQQPKPETSEAGPPRPLPPPLSARSPSPPKREADSLGPDGHPKRRCTERVNGGLGSPQSERKNMGWKALYASRYLIGRNWKMGRCSIKTFRGHENGITCLQLDDNILATGSYDATIKIWDITTGQAIRTLRGHTRGVRSIQLDDSKLISSSLDGTVKIWNWHTGECLSTLRCHTDGVLSVNFDGQVLASGSIDQTVKIFNFDTKRTFCLRGHKDWVNQVRLCMGSRIVFSASDDTTAKLWDLDTRQCIRTFVGHVGHVQQLLVLPPDFEPDDELLSFPSMKVDNTDTVSTASGRSSTPAVSALRKLSASQEEDLRASYGPAFVDDPTRPLPGRYILTGGLDSTIRLWDTSDGRCYKTWFGHLEGIWGLAGDTLRVLSGANDGMVKIWEPRSGKCERSVTGHRGPVSCVGLSDSHMASGGEDGEVRLYSFSDVKAVEECGTPN